MLEIDQIQIDPEFAKSFTIDKNVLDKIKKSMQENGFDESQPIVVWETERKFILVDGHTRR